MLKVLRSSPLVVVFWLVCLATTVAIWRLMPTKLSQASLIILLVLVVGSTLLKQTELPIITTIFLSVLIITYWQIRYPSYELLYTVLVVALIPIIGMAGDIINRDFRQMDRDEVFSHWLILGLFTAESLAVFSRWPVSFFNRTLLTMIVFYTFWHYLRIQHNVDQRRSYIAHFIFVAVAVIVVIGIIIWANFPHLTS